MRYYLIDKVIAIEPGKSITGVKCITLSDDVLHDHFPTFPVMPGALIVEAMAQLGGFLLELTLNTPTAPEIRRGVLAQIDRMKFHKMSGPGDRLEIRADIESILDDAAQLAVQATADGETRVKGRLTFATISFDSPRIQQQRMETYKIWTRDLKECPPIR